MGGTVKNVVSNPTRLLGDVMTMGTYELGRKALPGLARPLEHLGQTVFGVGGQQNPYVAGPFTLDPEQLANDQAAINALGEKQYQETTKQIPTEISNALNQSLPGIAEDYNAHHLLDSSGYGNEVARQQANLAANLVGGATAQRQGFQQSALGRGLSLEDFINQANVAKTIGAQAAPQVGNGKGQTGALLSGVGALAPLAGALMGGPAGAAAGSAIGAGFNPNGPLSMFGSGSGYSRYS